MSDHAFYQAAREKKITRSRTRTAGMHASLDYNYPVLYYLTVLFAMQSFIRLVSEVGLHGLACHPRHDGARLSFMLVSCRWFWA